MIRLPRSSVPALTAGQMREVDRVVVEDLGIELIQMMENAGRGLAELAVTLYRPHAVTVLAGPGGNGGGGMAGARHLANRGVDVTVILSEPDRMAPAPGRQLEILRRMEVAVQTSPPPCDLVVDALIGYSLRGAPRGRAAALIEWANRQESPVLALDAPSGLDVTSGQPANPCVRAAATLTLALPKVGLLPAGEWVGRLFLADISVPAAAYRRVGVDVPAIFAGGSIVELEG